MYMYVLYLDAEMYVLRKRHITQSYNKDKSKIDMERKYAKT